MKKQIYSKEDLGTIELTQTIGFSSVPDLIRTKSIEDGFEINVLVTGRRGLGASTLINSLFGAPIISKTRSNGLTVTKNEIVENGISLETTTVTYHSDNINPLIEYINKLNNEYFENEQGPYRIHKDTRIHVCLYLIPSDHLTDNELDFMKKLSHKVNFIPVIPKADMYTSEELTQRKLVVHNLLQDYNINIFKCPHKELAESDVEDTDIPIYAVIASETVYEINGDIIRGRQYPWGFIDIDKEEGNDFKCLQRLLIYKHFDELINRTHIRFYNEYRKDILDYERNNEMSQVTRYQKLKNALENILKEKTQKCLVALQEEEALLDEMIIKMSVAEEPVGNIQNALNAA
ncbi:hypothetical protein NCER_101327 [Vairimorpha ceranae BRL01]|uniref:Septin-type G domain-containing protein n=2 Tax=Vairimorpha ceranae TaxID=40302 RepID=C4V9R6_VAIC1|nr:septin-like protein [Vairimorpha ceranae]EEQ82037.1 hypothetical protein NCER_101327 [Vairimorpha ceranae BRL01]KKO76714.1 septin-like protein [Vairimorpha ceranae]